MRFARSWRATAVAVGAVALVAASCGGAGDGSDEDVAGDTSDTEAAGEASDTEEPGSPEVDETDGDDDPAESAADGDVLSSLTIGMNNPNYATQLPTILADEWGYLAEEGIDEIEIINTDDYIPGLIGGSLDITQGDTDVAFGSADASGEGIVFLGTYRNNEYRILAGAEGIEDADDLVGGTVVTGSEGGRTYLATYGAVEAIGLDPDSDVEFVTTGGASDAWAQQLMNGQVQGAAIFPRHIAIVEAAGANILYNEQFEVPQEGLMVLDSFLEAERPTVVAFLRATLRARQDLQDSRPSGRGPPDHAGPRLRESPRSSRSRTRSRSRSCRPTEVSTPGSWRTSSPSRWSSATSPTGWTGGSTSTSVRSTRPRSRSGSNRTPRASTDGGRARGRDLADTCPVLR